MGWMNMNKLMTRQRFLVVERHIKDLRSLLTRMGLYFPEKIRWATKECCLTKGHLRKPDGYGGLECFSPALVDTSAASVLSSVRLSHSDPWP